MTCMKESGKMMNSVGTELICMQMGPHIQGSGNMICRMGMGSVNPQMAQSIMGS